ncbi:MAG TPA: MFS transporter [Acidimicrobiales bacterium]|nr:MFS transporter [Acidimicrobiales bacterium]
MTQTVPGPPQGVVRSAPAAGPTTDRPGLALLVVMVGVLIAAIDTTIVVLALPEIERSLHLGLASVVWVIISYLLVITIFATQVGRLGDMFGRVRMYEIGFVVFIVGSVLCALAWDETSIIAFRILQGLGGALLSANSGAVIADIFPPEKRGRAFGFNATGYTTGAVIGIVVGGAIVTYMSWRWIFWINAPIGVFAVLLAMRVLRDRTQTQARKLDLPGMITLGAGLFAVLWAMTRYASYSFSTGVLVALLVGIALVLAFVVIETRTKMPMLALSMFRIPAMTPSLLASLFQSLANFAVLFLVIMYLQGVRQLSPLRASLLLVPGYVLGAFIGPAAGRLADRVGPVVPATAGLGIQVVALAVYAQMRLHTPLWLVVVASVISSIGAGFFFPANTAAVMKSAPESIFGIASGMLRTFSNVGMVFSFAVAIVAASHSISRRIAFAIFVGSTSLKPQLAASFTHGLHTAFYSSMSLMVLAAILSALRQRSKPAPA